MELGLLTDSLSELSRTEALDAAAALDITTVEIALGGWSSAPHADLELLLSDPSARRRLADEVSSRGLRLEALNASGNPLHPVHGGDHDRVVRGALHLAEELEVGTIVLMSGLPAWPGDSFPAWITTVWPPENLTLLEHQWAVAADYWGRLADEGRRRGVRFAIEMHANQLVFNVPSLLRLRAAVGDVVGANFDPSHLFWMGADPLQAAAALTGAIHHVHAKDTRIEEATAAVTSRLEPVPNEQTTRRAWNYVAVGAGHDASYWARFLATVRASGYDGPVSIENEDYSLGQRESVTLAARTLREALEALDDDALTRGLHDPSGTGGAR
jgi:sugar phosphate isomerase/epimerase